MATATAASPQTERKCRQCHSLLEPDEGYRCRKCNGARQSLSEQRRASRLCIGCGAPIEPGSTSTRCERCNAHRREWERRRRLGLGKLEHWRWRGGEPPDPQPARLLRAELDARRARGERFGQAWRDALATVVEEEGGEGWLVAFYGTRRAWRDAYEGRGEPFPLHPTMLITEEPERGRIELLG